MKHPFAPGDVVEVIRTPPGADRYTPRAGTICRVTAVSYRRGNRHQVHAQALGDSRLEDWFPVQCLALANAWWRRENPEKKA